MAEDVKIKPAEGKIAIRFIGDDEDDDAEHGVAHNVAAPPTTHEDNEAEFAIVVGVGDKVTGIKSGDTVIVRKSARCNGVKLGDVRIVESWYLQGKVVG